MTEKRIYRNRSAGMLAEPQQEVRFGERDPMSAAAAAAGVPLCESRSTFYGKARGCTRALGHDEGRGANGTNKHAGTHIDASERGFIARAQW